MFSIRIQRSCVVLGALVVAGLLAGGCAGSASTTVDKAEAKAPAIRVNAGAKDPWTDPSGAVWLADAGFAGGSTVDRGAVDIANTTLAPVYRTEHWSMTGFAWKVPNGKYTVKLHFAETMNKTTVAGMRVFSVDVEGQKVADLDVFKEAGGAAKALVKTVNVTVADGELNITFTPKVQNPEINGIEIIPAK